MTEAQWAPEPREDGVRWTLDAFNAAVLDLLARGYTPDEARKIAAMKLKEDGEKADDTN